jgi:8-oxo-dGTP pyrophosphatase MutT (NUDIX family)
MTAREGADAFVRDHAGRVLLVRRADDGRWAMPGGWVEPAPSAETPEVAFIDPATVTRWHADHGRRVAAAIGGTGATEV